MSKKTSLSNSKASPTSFKVKGGERGSNKGLGPFLHAVGKRHWVGYSHIFQGNYWGGTGSLNTTSWGLKKPYCTLGEKRTRNTRRGERRCPGESRSVVNEFLYQREQPAESQKENAER